MRRRSLRPGAVVLTAAAAALVTACGSSGTTGGGAAASSQSPASGAKITTVSVSYVPYVGAAPFVLGVEKGFFAREGLSIQASQGVAPAPIMAEVVAGKTDIGFTTIPALIAADSNGAPLQIVSPFDGVIDAQHPESAIMVRPGSGITRPRDLAGKKVGVVALQSELDVLMRDAVRRDGGDPAKVQSVQIPFPEMTAALKAGRVDAVVNTEPFVTLAEQQGMKAISHPEAEIVPGGTVTGLVAARSFIASHGDVIRRFRAAMTQSLEYAAAHPAEARATMVKVAQLSPSLLSKINLGTVFTPRLNMSSIATFIALQKGFGFIHNAPTAAQLVAPGAAS